MTLCDIGNSTFHFKTKKNEFKIGVQESLKNIKLLDKDIYFVSVNSKGTKKFIKNFPSAIDLSKYIKFETTYIGMGLDRQIVCKYLKNAIIVDFGSAITVDIMKNSKHKGGFILPGFKAYRKIYPKISKKLLFKFDTDINLDKIPHKTDDAINYAIMISIVAPILRIYEKYRTTIYFTGEDSKKVLRYFDTTPYKYKKDLIFKSMKKVINENIKENRC